MKQSEMMSRTGSQKKKPINQNGRRTALTFRVVLLPSFLNASYNIGARYFVRAIVNSLPGRIRQAGKPSPVTAGQLLEAKVPSAVKRSTCTLSTLISLNAVLAA